MGSGGGANQVQKQEVTTTNLPKYLEPYVTDIASRAQAESNREYTPYEGQRIAGFSDAQKQAQDMAIGMQRPDQYGTASNMATQAGIGALNAGQNFQQGQFSSNQVQGPQLQNYQMQGPQNVAAQQYNAPQMRTAQTGYNPQLQDYQMQGPANVSASQLQNYQMQGPKDVSAAQLQDYQMAGPDKFDSAQVQQYMSPYMQNVVDVQKQQAVRDAKIGQLAGNLGASRQGTYGGARQLLASTERERNLGQQMGQIQATGSQNAFQNAQQQFNTQQQMQQGANQQNLAARLGIQQLGSGQNMQAQLANQQAGLTTAQQNLMSQLQTQGLSSAQALQAALANQQSGLTTGQQNLGANLQTQNLRTTTGTQTALANLSAQQQANVQNQAARLQQQGLNQQQALQAALANQTMGYNVGNQNLQANLDTQRLGSGQNMQAQLANQQYDMDAQKQAEQSKQFGANLGLQGYQAANSAAQNLGNLGTAQQTSDMQRMQATSAAGREQQGLQQQRYDQQFSDFLRQQNFPMEQLSYYSNLVRGLPQTMNTSQTTYAAAPSMNSQLIGAGIGALGQYQNTR